MKDNILLLDPNKPLADVIDLDCVTTLDLDPDKILTAALGELNQVVIIGYDKEGKEYFCSSVASGPDVVWLLERCKKSLLEAVDE